MICKPCYNQKHDDCPKGNWCDCQHVTEGVQVNWAMTFAPDTVVVEPTLRPVDC